MATATNKQSYGVPVAFPHPISSQQVLRKEGISMEAGLSGGGTRYCKSYKQNSMKINLRINLSVGSKHPFPWVSQAVVQKRRCERLSFPRRESLKTTRAEFPGYWGNFGGVLPKLRCG